MEQITYEENILLKAIELAKIRFGASWDLLNESARQVEIVMATPQAERAMEWASEIAHAVNGPQLSASVIDQMLRILGVIPPNVIVNKEPEDLSLPVAPAPPGTITTTIAEKVGAWLGPENIRSL